MLPISDEELLSYFAFENLALDQFLEKNSCKGILGAISGGPDSTVLLHGLALFQQQFKDIPVIVATVDHGLRGESINEAHFVGETAQKLGLKHHIVQWEGPYPQTGLQEAARSIRYQFLAELAQEQELSTLLTAHTLDDQAETLLMRMSRGSGVAGLAGMRTLTHKSTLYHFRPFLSLPKTRLIATCENRGWSYFSDPSNENPKYARSRWRKLAPLLSHEGLTAERLGRLAERCARANDALEFYVKELYQHAVISVPDQNIVSLDVVQLVDKPDEVALRVLIKTLQDVTGAVFLRLERVEFFYELLKKAVHSEQTLKRSLGRAVLELTKDKRLVIKGAIERVQKH